MEIIERIKSYLEGRLKRLESIRKEREFTTAELGDIACCKQTLAFIDSLAEPVSEELGKAHNWKPADGDDLPDIDREVIALLDNGKVVFAHRPPEYWDGKDIVTGKVTRNYPKTYDKGGWNIPDIKWWLDVELPKEIKL